MTNENKYDEPQSLLDVREWKRKVSEEIERLGYEEFHRQAKKGFEEMKRRIEMSRKNKQKAA